MQCTFKCKVTLSLISKLGNKMKIIAFAASNSRTSINQQLIHYATKKLPSAEVEILDLNDFEMPIFSEDREKKSGYPELAHLFHQKIKQADGLIISFAEHNGYYSAAYKNIFDWVSRIEMKVYQNTKTVMLSTSPGPGGAARVLEVATSSAEHFAADVTASLSIPNFYQNFDIEKQEFTNLEFQQLFEQAIYSLVHTSENLAAV